jgi:hypothetical protein
MSGVGERLPEAQGDHGRRFANRPHPAVSTEFAVVAAAAESCGSRFVGLSDDKNQILRVDIRCPS